MKYASITDRLADLGGAKWKVHFEARKLRAEGRKIIELTGADPTTLKSVADRPGHDRRYALDCSKLRALGWERHTDFDTGLALTVEWFRANRPWWEAIKSGEAFADYASKNYGSRR